MKPSPSVTIVLLLDAATTVTLKRLAGVLFARATTDAMLVVTVGLGYWNTSISLMDAPAASTTLTVALRYEPDSLAATVIVYLSV